MSLGLVQNIVVDLGFVEGCFTVFSRLVECIVFKVT